MGVKYRGNPASIQGIVWLLLAVHSQIYSKNDEQNTVWKGLKILQLAQERNTCKVGTLRSVTAEESSSIKKKHFSLYEDNSKELGLI